MSKIVSNLWFKKNSIARRWLERNLELDQSFSKTFRTTGGTFKYYENEILLKKCSINGCHYQSVGSFPSKGGAKLSLCQMHVLELEELQVASVHPLIILIPTLKFGLLNILSYAIYNFSEVLEIKLHWIETIFHM